MDANGAGAVWTDSDLVSSLSVAEFPGDAGSAGNCDSFSGGKTTGEARFDETLSAQLLKSKTAATSKKNPASSFLASSGKLCITRKILSNVFIYPKF